MFSKIMVQAGIPVFTVISLVCPLLLRIGAEQGYSFNFFREISVKIKKIVKRVRRENNKNLKQQMGGRVLLVLMKTSWRNNACDWYYMYLWPWQFYERFNLGPLNWYIKKYTALSMFASPSLLWIVILHFVFSTSYQSLRVLTSWHAFQIVAQSWIGIATFKETQVFYKDFSSLSLQ